MFKKSSNPYYHILYWIFVIFILTLFFGRSWGNNIASFFFVSMLLPITLGTSYFFNYVLVSLFYLKKSYWRFGLYSFYLMVVSLYLQSIVIMFAFIYLGNFNYQNLPPNASDTLLLAVVMYLLVFLGSFLLMTRQIKERENLIQKLLIDQEKNKVASLQLRSNRKTIQIPYNSIIFIESMADYIKVHTIADTVTSKEKISKLAERLPEQFMRIHRSFIVNKSRIKEVSYNELTVDNVTLNIGRSYQKTVREELKDN
ncbi:LytR/AlgR family response regulator transcription factor [Carboxylicivirga linearis]|uniref:LytTR family transcriptional regulator n=1 Tax=Carboxylicivirga linearis TaxID=1628157 RepID=A0ABS5JUL5_9BACT|nr:LytTR family DNA-binding domain-containing protein [Carboxylicivirga linearis]MBS2098161.1 LytTR family transcriptional regulator [Carboxylicivirga linearis]